MASRRRKRPEKVRRYYDYSLLVTIIFLCSFGLVMIYSSSSYIASLEYAKSDGAAHFMIRQAQALVIGFVGMIIISKIDYHFYKHFAVMGYVMSVVIMVMVNYTPFGIERNGKKRWFGIPGTNTSLFQPAELVKIALILALACAINYLIKWIDRWKVIGLLLLMVAPPTYLVVDNNLSSGIIIFGIACVMYFVASRKKLRFAVAVAAVAAVAILFVEFGDTLVSMGILEKYQLERIDVWKDPAAYPLDGGFQVLQGLYAIGSGGIFGKGLGNSLQKLGFVPEAQNDMIFSIICEELGLFGAGCLILLFIFMIWRFMIIAQNAPDLFGGLLVVGIMAHIAIQVILNIAVVTNTIPNTGITLPFISYGGSSIVFLMAEMGLALSVSNQITYEK